MYIEREAVVKYIRSREGNFIDDMGKGWSNGMAAAASMCEKFPTADVAPVVHGEWDAIPNTYMSVSSKDGSYSGNATSCSVCHEVNPNAYKTNYCPNCGAKMDGGKHV